MRSWDPIIFCIKQTIELDELADHCHVHLANAWNLKKYRYDKRNCLTIYTDDDSAGPSFQKWDLIFQIRKRGLPVSKSLAATLDFAGWEMGRTGLERPWGPGIVYESLIHLLVHCGFREVHTIGWDIADASGQNVHFYDSTLRANALDAALASIGDPTAVQPRSYRRLLRRLTNYYWYLTGQKYNRAGMMDGEAELVAASLPSLRRYLEEKGVALNVHSDSSWMK
jgi:hypothetical protein